METLKSKLKIALPLAFFLILSATIISAQSDALPVYRFWNNNTGNHFYTISENEKNKVVENYSNIFIPEGVAFYAYAGEFANALPVYRFWNNVSGSHFYTIKESERSKILTNYSNVFIPEGIAFYAFPDSLQTVSKLRVEDKSRTWIQWKWENPSGNFEGIAVYIDGENVDNLSGSQTSYRAEDLEEGKSHKITLRIINNGKVSSLGVSDTESTESTASRTRIREVVSETPVVFTSFASKNESPLNLNDNNLRNEEYDLTQGLSTIHYVLIALVILSLIVLFLIFKNI